MKSSNDHYYANKDVISEKTKIYYKLNADKKKAYAKEYAKQHPELISERNKRYREENKCVIAERAKAYRKENKEKIAEGKKEYNKLNAETISKKRAIFRQNNKKVISARQRKYKQNNRSKLNENTKRRRLQDPKFRLLCNLRGRIREAIHNNVKSAPTKQLLGRTIEHLKIHLQKTAVANGYVDFDINNYSSKEYHIDHILPCDSFDMSRESEQRKCFHYTNLQILTAEENIKKGNKLNADISIT